MVLTLCIAPWTPRHKHTTPVNQGVVGQAWLSFWLFFKTVTFQHFVGQRNIFIARYIVPAFAFRSLPGVVTSELGFVRWRGRDVEGILGSVNIKLKGLDLTWASTMLQKKNMRAGARIRPWIYAKEFGFYPEGHENVLKDCRQGHDMTRFVI